MWYERWWKLWRLEEIECDFPYRFSLVIIAAQINWCVHRQINPVWVDPPFATQYPTRAKIETGSAGRGASTTMKHLMEYTSTFLEPALTFWPRTAILQHLSTQCG